MEDNAEPAAIRIAQAARELDVTRHAVYKAINRGALRFIWHMGLQLVTRESLDEYKARTRPGGVKPRGRPKGSRSTAKLSAGRQPAL